VVLLLSLACFDYDLWSKGDELDDPVWDTGRTWSEDLPPTVAGDCNTEKLPTVVQQDESCLIERATGDLQSLVEWELTDFDSYSDNREVLMAPIVGDVTGDGFPDILVVTHADQDVSDKRNGVMRLLDGRDGTQHWASQRTDLEHDTLGEMQVYPYRYSNAAMGDIDGDGLAEIVAIAMVRGTPPEGGGDDTAVDTSDPGGGEDTNEPQVDPNPPMGGDQAVCRIAAWSSIGEVRWVSEGTVECGGHAPSLADLEGDGEVEVVVGRTVLRGADGTLVWEGQGGMGSAGAYVDMGWHSVVSDLDGDGYQEVLAGNTVYGVGGVTLCETGGTDGFVAVADLDLDGQGEFVVTGNGQVELYEMDCSPMAAWALAGGGNGGPATLADFDADGTPEIGVADALTYTVYETDGATLWSNAVEDQSSHATGSAVYDFEGDGNPEVVYGDERTLWVFDGETGKVRLQDGLHESRTLHELPTVVDVDGDGHAEIIVPNGGSHNEVPYWGLYVLGAADNSWVAGGAVWNQHAFSITNVRDDLSIPANPVSNWPDHNNFRSGDLFAPYDGALPDAVPLAETCSVECGVGRAVLVSGVGNAGMGALPAGTELIVESSSGVELGRMTVGALAPGAVSKSLRLPLAPNEGRVTVRVQHDAVECDPDDDVVEIEVQCP
jgi:hypothetical protein